MMLTRYEDADLVQGRAKYVADLYKTGDACMVVVRSDLAHGRILEIDRDVAESMEGVLGVFTAEDLRADLGQVPRIGVRISAGVDVDPWLQPVLADGFVRYVGEPVAIVVATDRYLAEDAAEMVFADIEPLAPALDQSDSTSPPLFDSGNHVVSLDYRVGDAEAVFASAPVKVRKRLSVGRHSAVPLETRGLHVEFDKSAEAVVVSGATKVVHWNRNQLASHLGISDDRIILKESSVGGGFGVRGEFYPEDTLVPWAALKLRRSISWIEDRREHFIATNHARDQIHIAELAGDEEGNILGIRSEVWIDLGAYVRTNGMRIPEVTGAMIPGPYDIPAYFARAHAVVTNRPPTGTYRAPGRYESTFVCERLIDAYSSRIAMDPLHVRRKNLIKASSMPYERRFQGSPSMAFDEGDYEGMLDRVLAEIDLSEINRRRSNGELVGAAVTPYIESTRLGPWEAASVEIDDGGRVLVRSGGSSVGQGFRTMLSKVVADVFGIEPAAVSVEMLDTKTFSNGVGSYASRSTATAGSAAHLAALDVARTLRKVAAEQLEADPEELRVQVPDVVSPSGGRIALSELRRLAALQGVEFFSRQTFTSDTVNLDFGAVAAVVRIDPSTAGIRVEQLVVGFETGRVLHQKIVEGQLVGAALQGVGGALLERFRFDGEGNPLVTSFMDYLMPTMSEAPEMTAITFDEPSLDNPLGTKGVGEGGITGVGGVIPSAVENALSTSDLIDSLPVDIETVMRSVELRAAAL